MIISEGVCHQQCRHHAVVRRAGLVYLWHSETWVLVEDEGATLEEQKLARGWADCPVPAIG